MRLRIIRMDLPLRHVTIVKRHTVSVVRAVVVELEQDGLRGFGEVYEEPQFDIHIEPLIRQLEQCRSPLDDYALAEPKAFVRYLSPLLKEFPAAMSAIEMAACDLWGKMRNRTLRSIWGFRGSALPLSSYSLTFDSPYKVVEKYLEEPEWPIYRIILGGGQHDLQIIEDLRRHTDVPFRIDACGSWSLEKAIDYVKRLEDLNIEFIEQPLHRDQWEQMETLRKKTSIPLFADESCRNEQELERCARYFDGVNLKPSKFGGLQATCMAIEKAKHLGLQTLIGHTIESSVSASAMSQFAPVLDYIYLDGPLLIERKVGVGVKLNRGLLQYPNENGTGFKYSLR